jgi:hypothetical protein
MKMSELIRLIPAPAGYFILDVESRRRNGKIIRENIKLPVLAWGESSDGFDLRPVTPMGVYGDDEDGVYSLLLPDGSVNVPYSETPWFEDESAWSASMASLCAEAK